MLQATYCACLRSQRTSQACTEPLAWTVHQLPTPPNTDVVTLLVYAASEMAEPAIDKLISVLRGSKAP
jgi:hypothetical protein